MKRQSHLFGCVLFAGTILSLLVPAPVQSQMKALSTDELVQASEVVAVGKVRQKKAAWNSTRTRIETTVTLEVSEYLKGTGGNSISITVPGGEVGEIGELYSHTARFEKDEEVVVFARRDKTNRFQVAGGSSGKHSISTDSATGEKLIGGVRRLKDFVAEVKTAAGRQR